MNKDKVTTFGCVFVAVIILLVLLVVGLGMQNAELREENARLEQLLKDQTEWCRQIMIATVPYSIE